MWQCRILNPLSEARNRTHIPKETTSNPKPTKTQHEIREISYSDTIANKVPEESQQSFDREESHLSEESTIRPQHFRERDAPSLPESPWPLESQDGALCCQDPRFQLPLTMGLWAAKFDPQGSCTTPCSLSRPRPSQLCQALGTDLPGLRASVATCLSPKQPGSLRRRVQSWALGGASLPRHSRVRPESLSNGVHVPLDRAGDGSGHLCQPSSHISHPQRGYALT